MQYADIGLLYIASIIPLFIDSMIVVEQKRWIGYLINELILVAAQFASEKSDLQCRAFFANATEEAKGLANYATVSTGAAKKIGA